MPMRSRTMGLLVAFAVAGLAMLPAAAQPRLNSGDAANGKRIAERLCVGCHSVTPQPSGAAASSDILSFPAIARQPKATAEYLAGRIIIPHPAMPDTALNIAEIRDVIAYVLSFQTAGGK